METEEYRKLAEVEDRMWYFDALHRHLLKPLRDVDGAAALDAGCGTGGFLRRAELARPDWQWTGIDASPLAVELTRERSGHRVVEGSIEALPFGEGSFNAIVTADVLCQVNDDEAALREFHRVLRPGGTVVINVPAYSWLWSYHDDAVQSRRRYGRKELIGKLAAAGFSDIRTTHWNMFPLPLVVVRRKLLPAPADASDVHVFPAWIEASFRGLMAIERAWLRTLGALPAGSSILAIARRGA